MKIANLLLAVFIASWTVGHKKLHKEFPTKAAAWDWLNHCPKGTCSEKRVYEKTN